MTKVMHVVGARPNFMKVAPIMREMSREPVDFKQVLVHTGQHYDKKMSDVFFEELGMPQPDVNLEVGSGTHARQTAEIMLRFEPVLQDFQPDWVLVPGDVNSTLACALVASKLGVRVAHIEAGLRSFDRSMPEEVNRVLTDQIADLLLTPSPDAAVNLAREGIDGERVCFVGNVMIDTLVRLLPKARECWRRLSHSVAADHFALVTLHRPSNVDAPTTLHELMQALCQLSQEIPVIFPVHPRTRQCISAACGDLDLKLPDLSLIEPLGYLEFLALQLHARLVITDSGGVQEETTYLGIPCLTVRPNTERPITVTSGTNRLVQSTCAAILESARDVLNQAATGSKGDVRRPQYWDGHAAERIAAALRREGAMSPAPRLASPVVLEA